MDRYFGHLCVHPTSECSELYRRCNTKTEHYHDQYKDLKQQIHTVHTNYIGDVHLPHNGLVSLQTDTMSHTAHLTVVVASSRSKPGRKAAGRCVDHPTQSSAQVKERVELYLYSPSGPSWPVIGRTLPYII